MLKVGIIGSGFGIQGLLPAFESVRGSRVVGVSKGSQWRSFIERADLDAVAIAVVPAAQYTIATAAIERGLHVFAEKPLAKNLAQARALLRLAKSKRIVHGVDFMFPEINEWKKVKEMFDKKLLGKLLHVSVNWDWQSGDLKHGRSSWKSAINDGGGALSFYFSHGFHYLEHFAGPIDKMKTLLLHSPHSARGGEVGADILLSFTSGASGYAHVSSNSPGKVAHSLVFQCERGKIVLENENAIVDNFTVTVFTKKGEKRLRIHKDKKIGGEDERVKIVRKLAKRFVDACEGRDPMSPSFVEGVRVQELLERARAAA
jgi:predicted dehydrogenase